MKVIIGKQVYDQLGDEDRAALKATPCNCIKDGRPDDDCAVCEGDGIVYEWPLSPEDSAAIEENLRRQGAPLGKAAN